MIYTSYFKNPVVLPPKTTLTLAITAYTPEWWSGATYTKVAPPKELVLYYKGAKSRKDIDDSKLQAYYIDYYNKHVLNNLNAKDVARELQAMAGMLGKQDIVLLCFEKSSDFCHRHVLRDWLNNNGIQCEEVCYEIKHMQINPSSSCD